MKNLKTTTTLSSLFLIFIFCIKTQAQPLLSVNQFSSVSASNAISEKLGQRIQVPPTAINSFLSNLFNATTNPAIELIKAQATEINLPTATFAWSPIKGASTYNISQLNLNTGISNTSTSIASNMVLPMLHRNIYLFAFYSDGILGRSNLNILLVDMELNIIIDKDIFGAENTTGCTGMTSIPIATNSTFVYSKSFDWPNTCGDSTNYLVNITRTNVDEETYSSQYELMYEAPDTTLHIAIDSDQNPSTPFFFGVLGQYEILFTLDKFIVFYPNSDLMSSTVVSANVCSCNGGDPVIGNPPGDANPLDLEYFDIKSYPNPAQSYAIVNYQIPESSDVSIFIADALLQNTMQIERSSYKNKGSHQVELDLQSFTPGVYYCIIQTAYNQKYIKIVKTD